MTNMIIPDFINLLGRCGSQLLKSDVRF